MFRVRNLLVLSCLFWMSPVFASDWRSLPSEPGRKAEIDASGIIREGKHATASVRVLLDSPLDDLRSNTTYQQIEITTKYDCEVRNSQQVKRALRKLSGEVVREEKEGKKYPVTPIRPGTLDEKVFREVCQKEGGVGVAALAKGQEKAPSKKSLAMQQAQELAMEAVRKANEEMLANIRSGKGTSRGKVFDEDADNERKKELAKKKKKKKPAGPQEWGYFGDTGPEEWARLNPENRLCRDGERQSPIDLSGGAKLNLEPLFFNYQNAPFQIVDNGHTVQVVMPEHTLNFMNKTYRLSQLHFHRPSEESVRGLSFPMSVHFVHKSEENEMLVVAVLLAQGAANRAIQQLWNYIPLERDIPISIPDAMVDLNDLIPKDPAYYTYMGSLTTPPCTEGVVWVVFKQPVEVSKDQIAVFSSLYPSNTRPIQPTNGRFIKESR